MTGTPYKIVKGLFVKVGEAINIPSGGISIPADDTMGHEDSPQFPHCDALILHSPGTCEFCDRRPEWQRLRAAQGIAFSDYSNEVVEQNNLVPCPSTYRRSAEVRDRWPGNTTHGY